MSPKWLLLGIAALLSCSQPEDSREAPTIYSGQDVKPQFLNRFLGRYKFPERKSGIEISGLEAPEMRLHIHKDGTYQLITGAKRIGKVDDERSVVCSIEERGLITQVRKLGKRTTNAIQVGVQRYRNFDGVSGYMILQPRESKMTSLETVIFDKTTQTHVTVPDEKNYSNKEVQELCQRSSDRVFFIEEFLGNSFLLARSSNTRQSSKLFLEDKLVYNEETDKVEFENEWAARVFYEIGQKTRLGVSGIEILGENVLTDSLEATLTLETLVNDKEVSLKIGTRINGNPLGLVEFSGRIEALSYIPSSGRVHVNLSGVKMGEVSVTLEPSRMSQSLLDSVTELKMKILAHSKKLMDQMSNQNLTLVLGSRGVELVRLH